MDDLDKQIEILDEHYAKGGRPIVVKAEGEFDLFGIIKEQQAEIERLTELVGVMEADIGSQHQRVKELEKVLDGIRTRAKSALKNFDTRGFEKAVRSVEHRAKAAISPQTKEK